MSRHAPDGERGAGAVGPAPLGRSLRTAREAQGLSLPDIARSINVRETLVSAIESDDFTLCGGDVYARGHIRAYARRVGLDPAPLVTSYDARTGAPPEGARVALLGDDDVPLERRRRHGAMLSAAVVVVVVVVALLGWRLASELVAPARPPQQVATVGGPVPSPSTTPTGSASSGPRTPTGGPSPSARPSSGPSSGPSSRPTGTDTVVPGRVVVALRVTGRSWVGVRDANGRAVWSGLLGKGDAKRFTDDSALHLTLGNAGGVQLTVNGTPLGAAGRAGEVKRLTFRPAEAARPS